MRKRSNDGRIRLALFGINLDLLAEENASAVTARARDSQYKTYSLNVEFVGKVPNLDITQVIVSLPDALAQAGDVWITVTLHGATSHEVLFGIGVQTEPRFVTILTRSPANTPDNYADATFSFEHGMNGGGASL